MIRRIAAGLPGFVTIDGQTVFSVRYGTRFGMTPEEVAALELEHGYEFVHYDPESPDVRLYDSGKDLELCYEAGGVWMGPLKLYRFEYACTRPGERL